jgi:hypothetical protein
MRFYVSVTPDEFAKIRELAWQERRVPREQAAVLIANALRLADQRAARQARSKKEATYAAV